jgi:hypothetical protein
MPHPGYYLSFLGVHRIIFQYSLPGLRGRLVKWSGHFLAYGYSSSLYLTWPVLLIVSMAFNYKAFIPAIFSQYSLILIMMMIHDYDDYDDYDSECHSFIKGQRNP